MKWLSVCLKLSSCFAYLIGPFYAGTNLTPGLITPQLNVFFYFQPGPNLYSTSYAGPYYTNDEKIRSKRAGVKRADKVNRILPLFDKKK